MLSVARNLHLGRNIYSTATCLRVGQQGVLGRRAYSLPPQNLAQQADAPHSMNGTQTLAGTEDRYDGIQIDPAGLPNDPTEFTLQMTESLLVTLIWKTSTSANMMPIPSDCSFTLCLYHATPSMTWHMGLCNTWKL